MVYVNCFLCCLQPVALASVNLSCLSELSCCYLNTPERDREKKNKSVSLRERWVKKKTTLKRLLVINLGLLLSVRDLKIPWACFCFCTSCVEQLCPRFQQFLVKAVLWTALTQCRELFQQFLGNSEALESHERSSKMLAPAKDLKHDKQGCPSPTPPTQHTHPSQTNLNPHPTGVSGLSCLFKAKLTTLLLCEGCGMCLSDVECEVGGAGV